MQQEQDPGNGHILRKWVSLGDVISLALSLTALGVTYGQLSADVRHTNETVESVVLAVQELQNRDITPGARTEIAEIRATDLALQRQVTDVRDELREQRRDIVSRLDRIETQIDGHVDGDRRTK